jgi:hypothetical protein
MARADRAHGARMVGGSRGGGPMSLGVARRERLFPLWLGGPLVSELAYRIFLFALPHVPEHVERVTIEPGDHVSNLEVVERLADRFERDEADVCRALAELERVGVFTTERGRE